MTQDDELLEALRAAHVSEFGVASRGTWDAHEATHEARRRARVSRRRHRAAVALFIAALAGASTSLAVQGVALPGPVRRLAYDVGLPVQAPAVVASRHAITDLTSALRGDDAARIAVDARKLRERLAGLPASDRARIAPQAVPLLEEADREAGAGSAPQPSPTTTEQEPAQQGEGPAVTSPEPATTAEAPTAPSPETSAAPGAQPSPPDSSTLVPTAPTEGASAPAPPPPTVTDVPSGS